MTREEYFMCLEGYLKTLSYEECKEALQYYENYFDEAGPENEQEVINQLGSPKQLAESILRSEGIGDGTAKADDAFNRESTANVIPVVAKTESKKNKTEEENRNLRIIIAVIVIIIGFPVIMSVLGAVFGIVCALGFGGLGLVIGGLAGIVAGIALAIKLGFGAGCILIGASVICIAVGMIFGFLLYVGCKYLVPVIWNLLVDLWNYIMGKKEAK